LIIKKKKQTDGSSQEEEGRNNGKIGRKTKTWKLTSEKKLMLIISEVCTGAIS